MKKHVILMVRQIHLVPVWVRCLFLVVLTVMPAETQAADGSAKAPLGWQIHQVFTAKCADCHGGHRKKPKGGFGFVLDLKRLGETPDMVIPGDAENSPLYQLLVTEDEDDIMPPVDHKVGAMSPEQIDLVKTWINTLGQDPAPAHAQAGETESKDDKLTNTNNSPKAKVAYLHPVVIHFPIACIIAALFGEFIMLLRPTMTWLAGLVRGSLWIGVPGGALSALSGWNLADVLGYSDSVFNHRWLGIATLVAGFMALALYERYARHGKAAWAFRMLLLIAAGLAAATGHTGGEMVHSYVQ